MAVVNEVNAAQQRELYGAALGDLCREVMGGLALTQSGLAGIVGLSAPMLSQLISAQRVKIANPVVLHRLQSLVDLVRAGGDLSEDERRARVEAIREETATLTMTARRPEEIAEALRATATADELRAAGAAVPGTRLAELLAAAAQG